MRTLDRCGDLVGGEDRVALGARIGASRHEVEEVRELERQWLTGVPDERNSITVSARYPAGCPGPTPWAWARCR